MKKLDGCSRCGFFDNSTKKVLVTTNKKRASCYHQVTRATLFVQQRPFSHGIGLIGSDVYASFPSN